MKNRFRLSGKLMAAALLLAAPALPTAATPQTPDTPNVSLADTLTWLTSFLPTATGATSSGGVQRTSSITSSNGCNLTVLVDSSDASTMTYAFSLSDIDPTQVYYSPALGIGGATVQLGTRGQASLVKATLFGKTEFFNFASAGFFADQASAQRVVNAFQHAAQLCANASPF